MRNKLLTRCVLFALALVLVLGVTAAATPKASAETYNGYSYTVTNGLATITGYTGSDTNLVIPSTVGDGVVVDAIGEKAFQGKTSIKSVTLPSGLSTVGKYAFDGCTGLTEITLPKKLKNLQLHAFANCSNVTKITVNSTDLNEITYYGYPEYTRAKPFYNVGANTDGVEVIFADGCTTVPAYMFQADSDEGYAANITSVTIAESVTTLGEYAFQNCVDLKSVTIGKGVTIVGEGAFGGCTMLKDVSFPSTLNTIESYAFNGCTGLKQITFPKGLTSIGSHAFSGCTGLTAITLPEKLKTLGELVFQNCNSVETITIKSESLNDISYIGYPTYAYGRPFYNVGSAADDGVSVTFADGCTYVPAYLFWAKEGEGYCANITSVTMADTVTSIGAGAFTLCTDLETVNFGNGVATIGSSAFSGCADLKTLNFSKKLDTIGDSAFYNCGSLKTVNLPSALTVLGASSFAECTSLSNLSLPDSLTSIGAKAFANCTSLTEIILPKKLATLGELAFMNCTNVTKILIYSEKLNDISYAGYPTYAYYRPFYNVGAATEGVTVEFKNGCTKVPAYLFWAKDGEGYAANIHEVILADSVTSIGKEAFVNCTELEAITILDQVTTIGENAFKGCENTLTIYGYTDTVAESHATENNIKFVALERPISFVDVEKGRFYYVPVLWAVENGITKGMTETEFQPDGICTRGQVVTFLWRANGSPKPTSTNNPFVDVKEGAFYYNAVLWAVENGITSGMDPTHFAPNEPCTRGHVVTFLWRAMGKPAAKNQNNSFTDVKEGAFYYRAMLWAVEKSITVGMTQTTFEPNTACTRGQIVTFLYRTYN